jgi:cytidylate kinase
VTIITISRGSYSKGKEVAEGVAARLGYECISREVLLEASSRFNIPEIQLRQAFDDPPSILDRLAHGKLEYITYVQCALTRHARSDNTVYHGHAGHILLTGIPHVLSVRILASMSTRIAAVMQTGVPDEREARDLIERLDKQRSKWAWRLYGVDNTDVSLYDLVIHLDRIDVPGAIELIARAAAREPFVTTEAGQRLIDDLALACQVKAAVLALDHDVRITAEGGHVRVFTKAPPGATQPLEERLRLLVSELELEGMRDFEICSGGAVPPGNAV